MKVELIDYTGKGYAHPADYAARLLSRVKATRLADPSEHSQKLTTQQLLAEMEEIAMTIRSSWEFVDYTWQLTGVSRAFTHQFVRSRHFSFAQQAMRVADMSDFEYYTPPDLGSNDASIYYKETMHWLGQRYQNLRKLNAPAQAARGILPTNIKTNIIAKCNLRSLADMVPKRQNARVQDEYQEAAALMANEALKVHPWIHSFLYPARTQTPALDRLLQKALGNRPPVEAPEINDALKELDALKGTWG